MRNYVDRSIEAENAGGIKLSRKKFKQIRDEMIKVPFLQRMSYNRQYRRIKEYLMYGDTQPAVVVSTSPLIISAYSDEMDAVLLLCFPSVLVTTYNLKVGTRLVTSNIYFTGNKVVRDIIVGENYQERYINFIPIVQLFLSDQERFVRGRTELFKEEEWDRLNLLTEQKRKEYPNIKMRDGFFYLQNF